MPNDTSALSELRIGLVACDAMEPALTRSLRQAQVSCACVDANAVGPGHRELERYQALILLFGDTAVESIWFQPKRLRTNSRPLLLAAEPEALYARASLRDHADEIILAPHPPSELTFRLSHLISGSPSALVTLLLTASADATRVEKGVSLGVVDYIL